MGNGAGADARVGAGVGSVEKLWDGAAGGGSCRFVATVRFFADDGMVAGSFGI